MRQILIILLDNTIKFTPANGSVTVRAQLLGHDPNLLVRVGHRLWNEGSDKTEYSNGCFRPGTPRRRDARALVSGCTYLQGTGIRGRADDLGDEHSGARLGAVCDMPAFSIRNLLAPALKTTAGAAGPITCFVGSNGWLSDATRAEQSCSARELFERCLVGTGCLSPQDGIVGRGGTLFSSRSPSAGAGSLTRRIHQKFDEHKLLQKLGLVTCLHPTGCMCPGLRMATNGGRVAATNSNTRERGAYLKDGGKWLTK